MLYFNGMIH